MAVLHESFGRLKSGAVGSRVNGESKEREIEEKTAGT